MLATLCLQANHSVRNERFKFHYILTVLVWVCFWCFFEKKYMGQYMYLPCAEFYRQLQCFNNSSHSSDTSRTGREILPQNLNTQIPFQYSVNERKTESMLCADERIVPNELLINF